MALSYKKWRPLKAQPKGGAKVVSTKINQKRKMTEVEVAQNKIEINNYLNKISSLMKNPENARKAALIISEMLNPKIK